MSRAARFAAAKAAQRELRNAQAAAAKRLSGIPGVGSGMMGLTPDSVRLSPEYREAMAAHSQAFAALRAFNGRFVREFATELRAERKAGPRQSLKSGVR